MSRLQELKNNFDELPLSWKLGLGGGLLLGAVGVKCATGAILSSQARKRRDAKRRRRREASKAELDALASKLSGDQHARSIKESVVSFSLPELCDELKSGRLKAVEVLKAYQLQALDAHEKTNCLVEPVKEAEVYTRGEYANTRDNSAPSGLLHGVPVSIKEYFGLKGYDGSLGILKWLDRPIPEDSVLVKVLKHHGAIPFVRTNLPHMGFGYVTWNPVWGRTSNPLDTSRGPGGSSGGESALLAARGSVLGWGSDVGGSIRNPAHFCGLVGIKPTGNRISSKGTFQVDAVASTMPIVLGPMARDVDSLVLGMRAVLCDYMFSLDRSVPPIPFREDMYNNKRRLKIGFYTDNGVFAPVHSCQRAVLVAKALLTKAGHEVVTWQIPIEMAEQASDLAIRGKIFFGDEGKTMLKVLEGDSPDENIADFVTIATMPRILRRLLTFMMKYVVRDKEMARFAGFSLGAGSVTRWWEIIEEVQVMRRWYEREWEKAGIDALICPAFACPAMPVNQLCPHRGEGSDLQIYNVLDVPGGVVPVTTVTKDDVVRMKSYPKSNEAYLDIHKGMKGAEGLPVGVQVITPKWTEELCLRVMKELEIGVNRQKSAA